MKNINYHVFIYKKTTSMPVIHSFSTWGALEQHVKDLKRDQDNGANIESFDVYEAHTGVLLPMDKVVE